MWSGSTTCLVVEVVAFVIRLVKTASAVDFMLAPFCSRAGNFLCYARTHVVPCLPQPDSSDPYRGAGGGAAQHDVDYYPTATWVVQVAPSGGHLVYLPSCCPVGTTGPTTQPENTMYQDPHSSSHYWRGRVQRARRQWHRCAWALLGLGTVGAGTYAVLRRNAALIAARAGRRIEVRRVAMPATWRVLAPRWEEVVGRSVDLCDNASDVVQAPDIDVVVEAIGGTGMARELVLQAIAQGKHVVTANKALLAEHGAEIFAAARTQGVVVAYEGAVAVSIPSSRPCARGLAANRIEWVAGIINGTSNFILSAMRAEGLDFAQALAQAQALGYAEAGPALDVGGVDAAHKLSLLAANAFGTLPPFAQVQIHGIDTLDAVDVGFARQLGYCVKLLGVARRYADGLYAGASGAAACGPPAGPGAWPHERGDGAKRCGRHHAVLRRGGRRRTHGVGRGGRPGRPGAQPGVSSPTRTGPGVSARNVGGFAGTRSRNDRQRLLPATGCGTCRVTVPRVLQELARHGVPVQRMKVLQHPDHPGQDCLVLLTATTTLLDVGAALETPCLAHGAGAGQRVAAGGVG